MSISSLTLSNFSRASIQKIQSQILDANKEFSTGRHADVGATLGRLTGTAITYRAQETSISRMLESNKLVASRLETTQDVLGAIRATGDELQSSIITGVGTAEGTDALVTEAGNALQQLVGQVNTDSSGQYLFSGTQSDVKPLADGSAAVTAAFDTFLAAAGATRDTVSADQMTQYLSADGIDVAGTVYKFDDGFSDAGWAADWSSVTGDQSQVRISRTETIGTSVSANDVAFRDTAAAYSMIASLGIDQMGGAARAAVAEASAVRLAKGMTGTVALGADVGVRETRVDMANVALGQQQDIVKASYERLEGVDQTEASLRINTLKTQLEASFAVTGKLQGLSILDYI